MCILQSHPHKHFRIFSFLFVVVFCEQLRRVDKDGHLEVSVHVPDISTYAQPGSKLDELMKFTGGNIYAPLKVSVSHTYPPTRTNTIISCIYIY